MPERIQRRRAKGWRMPENTISVTRPGKWGNPFRAAKEDGYWWVKDIQGNYWDAAHLEKEAAIRRCIELYKPWIEGKIGIKELDLSELKGKNLACFCPLVDKDGKPVPCHAEVLLELCNE